MWNKNVAAPNVNGNVFAKNALIDFSSKFLKQEL